MRLEVAVANNVDDFTPASMRSAETKLDQIIDDIKEFPARLGRLETGFADVQGQLAELPVRMDRMSGNLDRIERRLDLADAESAT